MPKASPAAAHRKSGVKTVSISHSYCSAGGVIQNPPCTTSTIPFYSRILVNATGKFGKNRRTEHAENSGVFPERRKRNCMRRITSETELRGPDREALFLK